MIKVTRLNKSVYYLNPFLIETVEATPDTIITLVSGKKMLVIEEPNEVVERMNAFYQSIHPYSLSSRLLIDAQLEEESD